MNALTISAQGNDRHQQHERAVQFTAELTVQRALLEALAICDASERFWASMVRDGEMAHADRLRKIGLLRS